MSTSRGWLVPALLVGVYYGAVGRLFAWPTFGVLFFRWAAWAVSFVALFAHLWHEVYRRRSAPRAAAFHASVAVGTGGFLLALFAMIYNIQMKGASVGPSWLISLIAWPALTGIPAFLGAWVGTAIVVRIKPPIES